MIRRGPVAVLCAALALAASLSSAGERHAMRGVVLSVDRESATMSASVDAVPGFMAAMTMTFAVRDRAALASLRPGALVDFEYVDDGAAPFADRIRVRGYDARDRKQMETARLTVLSRLAGTPGIAPRVAIGERVPDFTLTDELHRPVALSAFSGKVVAVTFGYVRCPNPQYCFRLASNLGRLQTRLAARTGKDLILLTIVLDPEHDREQALLDYSRVWTSQPDVWHFLTGPVADLRRVASSFGVEFWKDEGSVVHSLNTAVIDRHGRLAATLEGNEFTADQLVDMVTTVLAAP